MPELFIDPAKAMSESYSATTGMLEDMQSKSAFRDAYAKAEADASGSKDMFKVNSLASQMAAASGNIRGAEKFEKQAQASKASALENALNQIKQKQAQFGEFERHLQLLNNPADAIKEVLSSDMSTQEKMQYVNMLKATGNDPQKFQELKAQFQNAAMEAKDRLAAQQKVLQMELKHQEKLDDQEIRRQGLAIQAGSQQASRDDRKDWREYQKQKDKEDRDAKQEKADNDLLMNYDRLEIAAGKIKDPEARKKALGKLSKSRQAAEDRIAGRSIDEDKPDSLGRHIAKPGGSKEEKQQAAIKQALGDKYNPKKKYRVDKEGNIYEE